MGRRIQQPTKSADSAPPREASSQGRRSNVSDMTPKPRRIVTKIAQVYYLVDRLPKYPSPLDAACEALTDDGTGAVIYPVAFGAETRSERTREREGWSSEAIEAVRKQDERRGKNRK